MTSLVTILRQLHLIVEDIVHAENQASEEYAKEVRAQLLRENFPRVIRMIEERQ